MVAASAHPDANIIYGTVIDDALGDEVRVTVIAAGFESGEPTKIDVPVIETPVAPIREKNDPVEVAATLPSGSALGGGATRKRIIFEEDGTVDELDVPDFLK